MARKKGIPKKAPEYKDKPPGRAKDGSKCYTRQNKAGGKYTTCEGTQQSRQKIQKGKRLRKTSTDRSTAPVTKPQFQEAVASLRSAIVSEAPGVVGMTSTMTPLGQQTFDALLGTGSDVAAGISAAIADRNKVGFYDIGFTGKIGSTNHFDIQEKHNTARGSWFHRNMTLSGNLKKSQVDDIKREFPDVTISQPELPPPIFVEDPTVRALDFSNVSPPIPAQGPQLSSMDRLSAALTARGINW
jgi:hypothetical protein